jgi:hypothetical protein
VLANRGAADGQASKAERVSVELPDTRQHADRGGDDFRADPVAGKKNEIRSHTPKP